MKHEKEWHTCDRCGKEIETEKTKILFKRPFEIGERYVCPCGKVKEEHIDLCQECVNDFKRFMKNE